MWSAEFVCVLFVLGKALKLIPSVIGRRLGRIVIILSFSIYLGDRGSVAGIGKCKVSVECRCMSVGLSNPTPLDCAMNTLCYCAIYLQRIQGFRVNDVAHRLKANTRLTS